MKKYLFSVFIFLICTATLSSCKKFLNEPFDNRLELKNIEDYAGVVKKSYPTRFDLFNEVLTDNFKLVPNLMQDAWKPLYIPIYMFKDDYQHTLGYTSPATAYSHFYNKIYMANLVIDGVLSSQGGTAEKDAVLAEALLVRSYCYFILTNLFGMHYNPATSGTDLAVPLILEVNKENRPSYSRSTVKEVYDQVEADLYKAIEIYEKNPAVVPTNPYRFSLGAAYAFATRLNLYKSDFAKTVLYADKAIGQKGRVLRTLKTDYDVLLKSGWEFFAQQFNDPSAHPNIIMAVQSEYVHHPFGNNWGGFYLAPEVLTQIANNDYRRSIASNAGTVIDNATFIIKNNTGWQTSRYVYFNMEEVLLNRAEGNLRGTAPNPANAVLDLEELRKVRLINYTALNTGAMSNAELLTEVYKERRVEFLTEGLRWYDIKRLGLSVAHKMDQNSSVIDATLLPNDKRSALQIPVNARVGNPVLENQLNPR
ncbi:RagB/SusD family nutrient uptake outer membrane protein [Pedobacter sp. KBW06]|uniref:RagB/SusD family nutrient uptake outer membrane protein n=1 Tax=Pedobacter sp. KBW06 TaxID=2153359 RepID=UPI000F5B4944|nr:RagB/SusD family nutrient uptake outer membrane protein [Pedobacter sp. KBW06]RQO74662.1 RagB/SusD family nutrient uptake outer membrane protein [Pedobacter sp. KBW06]